MSKRFGRRSKKRLRDMILALQIQVAAHEKALLEAQKITQKAWDQTRQIAESVEKISKHSAALPVIREDGLGGLKTLNIPIPNEDLNLAFDADTILMGATSEMMLVKTVIVDMHALQVRLRENKKEFVKTIHLEFDNNGPRLGYSVSGQVLADPDLPFVKQMIIEKLSHALVHLEKPQPENPCTR